MQTEEIKRKKLYDYLSQASQKAYSDIYLIANDVLAKSETRGRMVEFYLKGVMRRTVSSGCPAGPDLYEPRAAGAG